MSINAMANAAAARRPDMLPLDTIPKGLEEIALAAATPAAATLRKKDAATTGQNSAQIETALHVLFGYIPTEILTLYVAVLAALQTNKATLWTVFWLFFIATPIVVWLVYGAKCKAADKKLPLTFGTFPLWEMSAATIAYCAWALALPNNPFINYSWYSSAISGIVVLVASTGLGLLAPFFQRPLK